MTSNFPLPSVPPLNQGPGLQGLNEEQRKAVSALEGPVLIIAGAGTGKTSVIAHRVALTLATHPELSPDQVLALTFSRKACQEMLDRVEKLLGGYAGELGVFTFHGFCHRFLQDHAGRLALPQRLRLFGRVDSWVFFRKLLGVMRPVLHWNLSDPTDCIEGFLRMIGRAKDEMVSPHELAAYAKGLPEGEEQRRMKEAASVYRTYQDEMRRYGVFDFGDLVNEMVRGLKEHPELLAEVRERYPYILVDEFQDTNVAQIHLLKLLAGESGNICVVGDDDQAIYRFRGASFASFLLFQEAFPRLRIFPLTRNYRSSPQVLSVAQALIRHNEPDRFDPKKQLHTQQPSGPPVDLVVCENESQEAQEVCKIVQRLCTDSSAGGCSALHEVAVLYRAHSHRTQLLTQLSRAGVPYALQAGSSFLEEPQSKDLVAFLRILQDPADSVNLFRLLAHPIFKIPFTDLLMISRSAKERQITLMDGLKEMKNLPVAHATHEAVTLLLEEISAFGRQAIRAGVGDLVYRIAEESFFRKIFCLPAADSADPWLLLGKFLRFTQRYVQNHPQEQDLHSFLLTIDGWLRMGGEGWEEEEEEAREGAVRLMTIHQAKGLEFDWVILLGMVQGRFPSRERPEQVPFPVGLMKEPLPKGDHHIEEERRLCYVACTRARKGLFLMTQERAYHRPSVFVRQMLEAPAGSLRRSLSQAVGQETEPMRSSKGQEKLLPSQESTFPLPERFSYSQLETYRYCPLKYRYSYIYQIPVRPTPQMAFGTDLHLCLELFFRQVMNEKIPSCDELLSTFERLYVPGRYGGPGQEEEYRVLGRKLLTAFYRKNEGSFYPPLFVEKTFTLALGGYSIRGVVDRADPLLEGGVEIIDYKTGKPKEAAEPEERMQLHLYALASRDLFHLTPKRVSFYYLRTNEKLSFDVKSQELEATQKQLSGLMAQIRTGDFTPTPSLVKCRRCDFRSLCPASMA